MSKIGQLWEKWCIRGVNFPYSYDPVSKKPSVTLLMVYISFFIATGSMIALHFYPSTILGATYSLVFWAVAVIFYQIRKLQKAKFDIENKSFELENDDNA